jgi:hypothetical protein
MIRAIRWLVGIVALLSVFCVSRKAAAQEVDFCAFAVPPTIVQGYASFSVIYVFDVNNEGRPINLKPVSQGFTTPEEVQSCIESWKLPEYSKKRLVASFRWKHGVGWTQLAITGEGVKLTIKVSGHRCPYCASVQNPSTLSLAPD